MLLTGTHASEAERERFEDEAEAAAQLNHVGIVPIYEVGTCAGQRYFTMAYVPGCNLADQIAKGPLASREAANLLMQVAEAVSYAHQQGVIHRDLKPANILLDSAGRPVVTDFGIAKFVDAKNQLTNVGDVLGTPNYMPPEQARGDSEAIGFGSDVYSLGAILYALLTGRPPFQAATSLDTIVQVLECEPAPPRQLNYEVSRDLNTITMKCLAKDPRRRYRSAAALSEDLGRFLNDEPILARGRGPVESALGWCRKHLFVASVSGVMACLLIVVAIVAAVGYYRESMLRRELELELNQVEEQLQTNQRMLTIRRTEPVSPQKGDDSRSGETVRGADN
jgi:serine/threonine protein kinase